jgi:hypothetical protein
VNISFSDMNLLSTYGNITPVTLRKKAKENKHFDCHANSSDKEFKKSQDVQSTDNSEV